MVLNPGEKAPEFTLPDTSGQEVSLAELTGSKVVLYFYPKDNTPGCTLEAQEFTRLQKKFLDKGAVILGVSKDSVRKHKNFTEKCSLGIPLLADTKGEVCELYKVFKEKSMFGKSFMGINRTTYVISETGIIEDVYENVNPDGHAEKVLANLEPARELKD